MKIRTTTISLLTVASLVSSVFALAPRTETFWTGIITTSGQGQLSDKSFAFPIYTEGPLTLQFRGGPHWCSAIIIHFYADGAEVGTVYVSGANVLSAAVDVPNLPSGRHTIEVRAEGVVGGCNTGILLSWEGNPVVTYTPTVFAEWMHSYNIPVPDFDKDLDADGIPNIVEFVTGESPLATSGAATKNPTIYHDASGDFFGIETYRHPAHTGCRFEIEAADGLEGPWTTIAASEDGAPFTGTATISETPTADRVHALIKTPVSGKHRFFIRCKTTVMGVRG